LRFFFNFLLLYILFILRAGFYLNNLSSFWGPPHFVESPFKFRVGLYLGIVEEDHGDAFGSGVNRASRVEGKASAGEILVNEDVRKSFTIIWGEPKTLQLFSDLGEKEIKKLPPMKMYSFNWETYIKQHPENSLPTLVLKQFRDASVTPFNLGLADIANRIPVIWPVVPRAGVNAIHCGQLTIIRLLAMLGSPIIVLIADCGVTNNISKEHAETFKEDINSFATKMGIRNIRYYFMSQMFVPRCENCDKFHRHFQKVISQLPLEKLVAANNKTYSEPVKAAINQAPTLDFLKPALTIASILHIAEQVDKKCIVVVGYDEQIQWEGALDSLSNIRDQFGVLFNPILKLKDGEQVHQTERVPLYYSWEKIVEDMEKYDLANWLTKLHVFLSNFPESSVVIDGVTINPTEWQNGGNIDEKIDKNILAKFVFDNILTK
jgi:hypothetical protein